VPTAAAARGRQATFQAHAVGARVGAMAATPLALLTGGDDCAVCCFELTSLQRVGVLRGHTGPVLALCPLAPTATPTSAAPGAGGESLVASASADGTVRVWAVACASARLGAGWSFRCERVLVGSSGAAVCALASPAAGVLVSGDAHGLLEVWEAARGGARLRALGAHNGYARRWAAGCERVLCSRVCVSWLADAAAAVCRCLRARCRLASPSLVAPPSPPVRCF
jgi:hypothetical protein